MRFKLFPTENEKVITIAIISFMLGSGATIALISGDKGVSELLPAYATLIAAFIGSGSAFLLENNYRKRKSRQEQLDAANRVLYALFERLNSLKLFQYDFIDPTRGHPAQMIAMQPVLSFKGAMTDFNIEELSFIFQSKYKHLLIELHVANEKYNEAVNSIRYRSHLHLNDFQPKLEAMGHINNSTITDLDVRKAIGDRGFEILKQSTETVVFHVDTFIKRGNELRADLIKAFSETFSSKEIFSFELADKPLNNPMHAEPATQAR